MQMRWMKNGIDNPQLQLFVNGFWRHWSQTSYRKEDQFRTIQHLFKQGWKFAPTHEVTEPCSSNAK